MTTDYHHLIPIADLVKQAKAAGYIFGKGDPKNRLRYFTKLGLIPRAVRLRAGDHDAFTVGYYPAYTVHLLLQMQHLKYQGQGLKAKGQGLKTDKSCLPSSFGLKPSSLSLAAAQRGALPAGEHRPSRPHGRVEPSSPLVTTPPPPQLSWRGGGHTTQERLHWAAANPPKPVEMYPPSSGRRGAGTTEAATVETVNLRMIRAITHYIVPASILAMLTLAINRSYIAPYSPTLPPHPPAVSWAKLAAERQLKLGQRNLPEAARPQLASSSGPEGLVGSSNFDVSKEAIWFLALLETKEPDFGGDFFPSESAIKLVADVRKGKNLSEGICSLGTLTESRAAGKTMVPSLSSLVLGCETPTVTNGSGRIEAGQTGVEIANPAATPTSRILITPTTVTAQPLAVINKRVGNFTVTLPTATKQPVTFDWFILAQ